MSKRDTIKRRIKTSMSYKVFQGFNTIFLILLMIVTVYPMVHVVMASFSEGIALTSHKGLLLWPAGNPTLDAFKAVFTNPNILKGYRNTMFVLIVGISLQIFMTSLGAYVLSRKKFALKNPIMFFITFTMFFQGGIIPFYLLIKDLNLINNLFSLILPFVVSAYNLIIMRTSFAAIPDSLEESAKLDGASHFAIYARIVMPLSKAVIAVMLLYYGVGIWNGWFWASVFLRNRSLFPLQLVLREILISNDVSSMTQGTSGADVAVIAESIKFATIVVATVPILSIYPFLQRYFAKGVMIGAIKG
ncbi:MAG: binding-protein-dependent transport system inner rane component [Herbinix sp.]|nr:binding-protein-dependent transport system inner rane component [Herbinix sp.]